MLPGVGLRYGAGSGVHDELGNGGLLVRRGRPDLLVNVAATWVGTRALGPGLRSVVWVQGCPFDCPGCIAPEWIPRRPERTVGPEQLAAELVRDPSVSGLTFSGGEPMLQAAGLAAVVRSARRERELSLICFTGYRLERLRRRTPDPGVAELLSEVDVLVDGPYVARRNTGRGLRGSDNQRVHHLTSRLRRHAPELLDGPRTVEIGVSERSAILVGIPPIGIGRAFDMAVERARAALPRTDEAPARVELLA
jgi:anaerobic ribonucleoside-triphosphate reductase activating protein